MVSLPHLNAPIPKKDISASILHAVPHGVVIRCEIIFGSPSMDCRGTGICKIISTEERSGHAGACASFPAYIAAQRDGNRLLIFFSKQQLSDAAFSRHFPENTLSMNEACPVPEFIQTGLETDISSISAGKYQLQSDGLYVFIAVDTLKIPDSRGC